MNTSNSNPAKKVDAAATTAADITAAASMAVAATKTPDVKLAYHDGPPHIGFYGRRWKLGEPQSIPAADWDAMQTRSDCAPFDFRVVS